MKRGFLWRAKHVVHNCIAHPLLPIATLLSDINLPSCARPFFWFHDVTSPDGDPYNKQKFN